VASFNEDQAELPQRQVPLRRARTDFVCVTFVYFYERCAGVLRRLIA
jgi:hypothetical protein